MIKSVWRFTLITFMPSKNPEELEKQEDNSWIKILKDILLYAELLMGLKI